MGILFGFAPWIVYWVLVGNVPFKTAVLVALGIAVLSFVCYWVIPFTLLGLAALASRVLPDRMTASIGE